MADTLNIRGIDREHWRQLRMIALQRGQPAGQLLDEIIAAWLEQQASPAHR